MLSQNFRGTVVRLHDGAVDTSDRQCSIIGAQNYLLEAVRSETPAVLRRLQLILPDFQLAGFAPKKISLYLVPFHWFCLRAINSRRLTDLIKENANDLRPYVFKLSDAEACEMETKLLRLRDTIWQWSFDCGLDADWCRKAGFFTLASWSYYPETDPNDWHYGKAVFEAPELKQRFAVTIDRHWDPARTSAAEFERLILDQCKREVRAWTEKTVAGLKEDHPVGDVKQLYGTEHFKWLVWRIVRGSTLGQIARKVPGKKGNSHITTSAVSLALKNISQLCEINLNNRALIPVVDSENESARTTG
jgi:hypothetical protein